jgi:hypothetical protein
MRAFLQRFASVVSGIVQGFDRLVFKGRLQQLYCPEGMHTLLALNQVPRGDFQTYAAGVTSRLLASSWLSHAKELERFRYLNSSKDSKDEIARQMAAAHGVQEGLVCVLQCVEPCLTFAKRKNAQGYWEIRGGNGKCSHLYHYYLHPKFGWMYVRLQTWFPFEIQVGINGREWLARQLDREQLSYQRSDNKFLWIEDWQRAQQLLDEQLQTDWVSELNALQKEVHPAHARLLGRMRVPYNWTVAQSEWATDVVFTSEEVLQSYFDRWLRQAFLNFDSVDVLRFLGRSQRITKDHPRHLETNLANRFDGKRIKHWLYENSLKLYNHYHLLRAEMTINQPERLIVLRQASNDPKWRPLPRPMRRGVVDMPLRAQVGTEANQRYLDALAGLAETCPVKEWAEPLTRRVPAPPGKSTKPPRQVRGLNPLAAEDASLLAVLSDPKWMIQGMRNRDVAAALYPDQAQDRSERRRRSAHVTHLLRLLRAHGLLEKIPGTHRYQLPAEARVKIQALLAVRNANPDELTTKAA